ncbi:MAG: HAD-IC family P-type ATPase [archaeon]
MEWYNRQPEDILHHFDVRPDKGLSTHDVQGRQKRFGRNQLKAKRGRGPLLIFLNQFHSIIIYILFFALAISLLQGEVVDTIVILFVLVVNAVVGFIQEYRAERAIDALRRLSGIKAKVRRNGELILIDSKELVPGDLILLEEGDKVPADARIIESLRLHAMEASLTGESVPVAKHARALTKHPGLAERKNMAFSGTSIVSGKATAVVTNIGMHTEIGRIAGMISESKPEQTPLQKKLNRLSMRIGIVTIIVCVIVFLSGVAKEGLLPILFSGDLIGFVFAAKSWFLTAVALAVAAVPSGMPAVITIALAFGVRRMVLRNALVRRLPSVETLGEATVICTDKTGTLTKNQMTVRAAYIDGRHLDISGEGYSPRGHITGSKGTRWEDDLLLFRIGSLCNNASIRNPGQEAEVIGDPTEAALLISANKAGLNPEQLQREWTRLSEEPFDSTRKLMSTVNHDPTTDKRVVHVKGAPESVLARCTHIYSRGKAVKLTDKNRAALLSKNEEYAKGALRVLAFAYKEHMEHESDEKNLVFVGFQGMIDPPHAEVKEAINRCKEAGIRVIMITGDNGITAQAIADEVGIDGKSMDGASFGGLSAEAQSIAIDEVGIFSRVEPRHKMRIVELLRSAGHVVAMTGDGVNDSPALKAADLGVAMGINGTDVAKEASEMVLLDDNFASIVNAVEEGRGIYANIRKFVNYLLSGNLAEVFVIFFSILFQLPLPMTAVMLLWLNLVTDGLPALALSVDPNPADLMTQPPMKADESIINRPLVYTLGYISVLITLAVLGIYVWAMHHYQGLEGAAFLSRIRTIAFTTIIILEIVRLQSIRWQYRLSFFSNKWLVLAVFSSLLLQLLVIYSPLQKFFGTSALSAIDWGMMLGVSVMVWYLSMLLERVKEHFTSRTG